MKKTKRIEKEFSDPEIDSYLQEFRRGAKEIDKNYPNDEVFPNDMNEVANHIEVLEDLVMNNPTNELKEELRVYKAFRSGSNRGWATAVECMTKLADEQVQQRKEPNLLEVEVPFTDEQIEKAKQSLANDPTTPKGHWEKVEEKDRTINKYIFDKEEEKK